MAPWGHSGLTQSQPSLDIDIKKRKGEEHTAQTWLSQIRGNPNIVSQSLSPTITGMWLWWSFSAIVNFIVYTSEKILDCRYSQKKKKQYGRNIPVWCKYTIKFFSWLYCVKSLDDNLREKGFQINLYLQVISYCFWGKFILKKKDPFIFCLFFIEM